MRRILAALGVVGIASALVLSGVPAYAVPAPPPPVAELPWKPSALVAGTGTTDVGEAARRQYVHEVRARWMQPQNPTTVPRPLAPPTSGTRVPFGGGAAGPLMLVQMAPAITNLGLKMWVTSSESGLEMTAEQLVCSTVAAADIGFVDWLYGVTPECRAIYTAPNADKASSLGPLTYGGFSASYTATLGGYYYNTFCYNATAANIAHPTLRLFFMGHNGSVSATSLAPDGAAAGCPGGSTHRGSGYAPSYPANAGLPDTPALWIAHESSPLVKVAEMAQIAPDPLRTPKCRTDWSDGTQTLTSGTPFKESEGLPLDAAALGCVVEDFVSDPGGPWPDRIRIETQEEGGSITTIADMPVPAEAQPSGPDEAPQPTRGLVLTKVVDGEELSCMTWEADCKEWWEESEEGTDFSRYRCTYQGHQIALAECGVYRNTFRMADPESGESVITDPVTGGSVGWGSAPGSSSNTTSPTTGPTPGERCMESWPSAPDPINWILRPVQCAFVWAFVPRNEKIAEFNVRAREDFDNSIPGVALGTVGGFAALFDVGSGCGGLPFVMDLPGGIHVEFMLFEACSEPMAGIAATVKAVLTFVIFGGATLAVIRYAGGLFAFNPLGLVDPRAEESGVKFR